MITMKDIEVTDTEDGKILYQCTIKGQPYIGLFKYEGSGDRAEIERSLLNQFNELNGT